MDNLNADFESLFNQTQEIIKVLESSPRFASVTRVASLGLRQALAGFYGLVTDHRNMHCSFFYMSEFSACTMQLG